MAVINLTRRYVKMDFPIQIDNLGIGMYIISFGGWRRETDLSPPVKYFTDRSREVLLLWIFYVFVLSCVCYVFVRVCLYVLCGHLLGKG